jgi:ribosome biogenesis protein Nip4
MYNTKLNKVSAISSFGFLQVVQGLTFFGLTPSKQPILEVGSGVGTTTKVILDNCYNEIYCYELNSFCRKKLMSIKKLNYKNAKYRMRVTSNIDDLNDINFCHIIVDGPISKKQLRKVVSNSTDLRLVAIENYRLLQRVWVAKALYKNKFRQQFVEILHNDKSSAAVFFTNKQSQAAHFHIVFDFILVMLRLLPKLILHTCLSKGAVLQIGKNLELPFERKQPKTSFDA